MSRQVRVRRHKVILTPSCIPLSHPPSPSRPDAGAGRSSVSLGFHSVKATSHIARLSSQQVAELMRRWMEDWHSRPHDDRETGAVVDVLFEGHRLAQQLQR